MVFFFGTAMVGTTAGTVCLATNTTLGAARSHCTRVMRRWGAQSAMFLLSATRGDVLAVVLRASPAKSGVNGLSHLAWLSGCNPPTQYSAPSATILSVAPHSNIDVHRCIEQSAEHNAKPGLGGGTVQEM